MSIEQSAADDVTSIATGLELVMDRFVSGFEARIRALGGISQETDALHSSFAAGGTSIGALALQILIVGLVTAGVLIFCRRRFNRPGRGIWWRAFSTLAAALIAIVAGLVVVRLLHPEGLTMRTLRGWVIISASDWSRLPLSGRF